MSCTTISHLHFILKMVLLLMVFLYFLYLATIYDIYLLKQITIKGMKNLRKEMKSRGRK